MHHIDYLLVPIPKFPYSRIGPRYWQDWYRQVQKTVAIARSLIDEGYEVRIVLLSNFKPKVGPTEIEIYTQAFTELAPELLLLSYYETNDTLGQVERSFELKEELQTKLIFISAWMQYLRVRYLARGREGLHHGVFGIPQPSFAFIDPFCILFYPLVDLLGLGLFFQKIVVRQRKKGRIL